MIESWRSARNILCVRLDSIGDVLMSSPALRALRQSPSQRRITLLASPAGAQAARCLPEVDEVIEFSAPWMKHALGPGAPGAADQGLIRTLSKERFDAAVIFTVYSQSPLPAAYLCYLAGVPLRLAHCRENPYHLLTDWVREPEPESGIRHEVRRQLDLVATVGCHTGDERLSFDVPRAVRTRLQQRLKALGIDRSKPLVLVHPGASAASRRYPWESFARALDLLAEREPCQFVLTGDAAEAALVDGIRDAMKAPAHALTGDLDLRQLGAAIQLADLVVTNNTGPAHIAAAVGTPLVDLYALTNPQHTPWMVESRVLFHDVPCRYCYKSVCPSGHHGCLRGVSPEEVAEAALDLLRGLPVRRVSLPPLNRGGGVPLMHAAPAHL